MADGGWQIQAGKPFTGDLQRTRAHLWKFEKALDALDRGRHLVPGGYGDVCVSQPRQQDEEGGGGLGEAHHTGVRERPPKDKLRYLQYAVLALSSY